MKFVKVFGERNTGTNFLNQLLRLNTSLKVLGHGGNQSCVVKTESICKASNVVSPLAKKFIFERMIDAERSKEFMENYGWKHAAVSWPKLKASEKYDETLFVCIIRNPWRFLTALHRRPYSLLPPPSGDFSSFLRSPLVANVRDGLDDAFLIDPVELWNQKVNSYHLLKRQSSQNVLVVYYEEIVEDIEVFMNMLGELCGLEFGSLVIPMKSTKGETKNFSDYRLEVQNYNPLDAMSKADADYICTRVDKNLIDQSPYLSLYNSFHVS